MAVYMKNKVLKKITFVFAALCVSATMFACSSKDPGTSSSGLDITVSTAPTTETAQRVQTAKEVSVLKVTGDGVNVRDAANTDGEILGQAEKGEYYSLKGQEGEWNQIEFDGKKAFISAKFSSVQKVTEAQAKKLLVGGAESGDTSGTEKADAKSNSSTDTSDTESSGESSEESSSSGEESSEDSKSQSSDKKESSGTESSRTNAEDIRNSEDAQAR